MSRWSRWSGWFFKNTKNKNLLKAKEKEMEVFEDLIDDIDMSKESDKNTVFVIIKHF